MDNNFKFIPQEIPEVILIEPKVYGDERGFFMETWSERHFKAAGYDWKFVQDNHSRSHKGVLRGLHYQKEHPQAKLVRVIHGEVFDVAVDIRKDSPTFGKWVGVTLTAENKKMLYIPEGFAHGFLTLSDTAEFLYKATDFYHPEDEGCIRWDDETIGVKWPLCRSSVLLNEKDSTKASCSAML